MKESSTPEIFQEPCPFENLLKLLLGQWTPLILWALQNNGEMRFTEIKNEVHGISARVLTERLRQLEHHGIINRHYVAAIPPQVSYDLTERGQELKLILQPLNEIARRWVEEDRKESA